MTAKERPLYMQGQDSHLWCEFLAATQIMHCNFSGYDNLQQNAVRMLAMVKERHPRQLAIDLRFNLGGDYMQAEKYVIQPLRVLSEINSRGHLCVLISPYTFSAGMSNTAQFRSETQAILVGQPIGERPNNYQEARELRLPNSHLVVRVSTRYYEFAPGGKANVIRPDKEIDRNLERLPGGARRSFGLGAAATGGSDSRSGCASLIAPGMWFPVGQEALFFLLGAGTAPRAAGI